MATGIVLVVALVAGDGSPSDRAQSAATSFGAVGRWITYPDGRVFLPHGFNSVVTGKPYYNDRLGERDAAFLAGEGFTAIRLALLPEAVEPQPGKIDMTYVRRFVAQVRMFARYGIVTLPDLNQDGYSPACGGDGFPAWAVLTSCEDVAALSGTGAWTAFWENAPADDGVGLQDHYLAWWRVIARAFGDSESVVGYDLMNEPKVVDEATLAGLWTRAIAAVHSVDAEHVLFIEARDPQWPEFDEAFPSGTGFTGHVYCAATLWKELQLAVPTAADVASCIRSDAVMLQQQLAYANRAGLAYLVGEFAATDELREQRALIDEMGEQFAPWLTYAYNGSRDSSGAPPQGILRNELAHGSQANAKQAKLDALVVPYPMAVAGTPISWRFSRGSRVVTFGYSTARVGGGSFTGSPPTVVFVPRRVYSSGYSVRVGGARVVSKPESPWLQLVALPGAEHVRLTIRPARAARTLTPLEAGRCGYDLRRCSTPSMSASR